MDSATRNYLVFLIVVAIGVSFWLLYEDPEVARLNDLLAQDPALTAYPYQFRVLDLKNGSATLSTPRSTVVPVIRIIGALYPRLGGRGQDDPEVMKAQQALATMQKKARALVMADPAVSAVRWRLDDNWLAQHGIDTTAGY